MLRIKNLLSEKKKDSNEIYIECYKLELTDVKVTNTENTNIIFLKKNKIKCDINFSIKKFILVKENCLLKYLDKTEFDINDMLIRLLIKKSSLQNMELY